MKSNLRPRIGTLCLAILLFLAITPFASAEDLELKNRIKDQHADGADWWYYNDLKEAIAIAKKENKPLFITFRCVPCKACAGFDAAVASGSERIEKLAREHFIPVRQVEMKGVDLDQFQFDYDLNWAAMFINADGTVYARYGTQSADGPDAFNSIESLAKTMERVVELHKSYPKNRAELTGKLGTPRPFKYALDLPALAEKGQFNKPTSRENCIHCHMINDAYHIAANREKNYDRKPLFRYPLPDNIGLTMDPKEGTAIKSLKVDSPAGKAGIVEGEKVLRMNGQAITSIADMQWVLHHLPWGNAEVEIECSESGKHRIVLPTDWKLSDISWRGSLWSVSPKLNMWLPEVSDEKKKELKLKEGETAYETRWINVAQVGGKAAYDAGIREGDLILKVDGKPLTMAPPEFHADLILNHRPGDKVTFTIMRQGKTIEIPLTLQE